MKNLSIFLIFTSCIVLFASCQNHNIKNVKILPLHPYSASPTKYDSTATKANNYFIRYYFIKNADEAVDKIANIIDTFVVQLIKNDSDNFLEYGDYSIYFYRETSRLNENFKEKVDGMINYDLLDNYYDDLLFIYDWRVQKFEGCKYYKNGKIIKRKTTLLLTDIDK